LDFRTNKDARPFKNKVFFLFYIEIAYSKNTLLYHVVKVYMSQGIEGIRHFRKSLGISGNAEAIEGFPVLPRQLWEFQAFLEMPRQLKEFLNFFYKPSILGNCRATKNQL